MSMLPFAVERAAQGRAVWVTVRGEVDMATGDRLLEEIRHAEAERPEVLVIDLRGVTFFDSTGLEILLDAQVRAREAPWELVVLPGDGEPRRVMELADVGSGIRTELPDDLRR